MTESRVKFGLTLPNRGVVIGATTVAEMLQLAADAESEGWDSVWVGDSIFAKPRLDAMVLLGAIAARTTRVRIGPACFASTPLRNALLLAYQWASLDFLSGGRTIFVACQGQAEPGGGAFEKEFAHFGIEPSSRMRRMEEAIEILRLTSSSENIDYNGQYWRFHNLTVLPRPVQQPIPIWVTANPDLNKKRNAEQAYRRVARLGDGWMTTFKSPEDVQTSLAMIRESSSARQPWGKCCSWRRMPSRQAGIPCGLVTRSSLNRGLTRWSCWGRSPPALRVCASDRPASPARRSATRCCWLTNGPVSTSSLAGAPFSLPVRDKPNRAAVPSKRNLPISGSSPRAGCAVWRKRSRYYASLPRARI